MNVLQKITKTEWLIIGLTLVFLATLALLYGKAADTAEGADYSITVTYRESEPVTPEAPAPININTASSEELQTLPGVGPALAERIIAYREENGPFSAIDGLLNVKGIGEATLAEFRDLVSVGAEQNDTTKAEDHTE